MDRVPTFGLFDPDHDQPTCGGRLADHLVRLPFGQVNLDAIWVIKDLLDLLQCDPSLGMVFADMFTVGSVSYDRPVVHPKSIYELQVSAWPGIVGHAQRVAGT